LHNFLALIMLKQTEHAGNSSSVTLLGTGLLMDLKMLNYLSAVLQKTSRYKHILLHPVHLGG
jgi:hypothetical protein